MKTVSSPGPYFSSEARTYGVLQGQSVTLQCSVEDLGQYHNTTLADGGEILTKMLNNISRRLNSYLEEGWTNDLSKRSAHQVGWRVLSENRGKYFIVV